MPLDRRTFLEFLGAGCAAATAAIGAPAAVTAAPASDRRWEPVSDRKIRMGIVGYGVCQFGAKFGFKDHPNVKIVAVSDLFPDRRAGLMKDVQCDTSYDSLEELVKDPRIEAVFVATDAPQHAQHCIEAMNHGKHVMTAVPAVWGSLEDAARLLETVRKTGLTYMMAETSCYRADCHAMRTVYEAGGFGHLIYSEGEYFHWCPTPIPSYRNWRVGSPPMWYPTHSTAYYIDVTKERFRSVSCLAYPTELPAFQKGANRYNNPYADEVALFRTTEDGMSRMLMCKGIRGSDRETGRVWGEQGSMEGTEYRGGMKDLPDLRRPPLPPGVEPGGHGGSHGQLSHEFITAILENRAPRVDIHQALAMTVPGIIAHQSALKGGETLRIPRLD